MAQLGIEAGHSGGGRQEARVLSLIRNCLTDRSAEFRKADPATARDAKGAPRTPSEHLQEFGELSALPFLVSGLPSLLSGLPSDARINSTNALAARGKWRSRR